MKLKTIPKNKIEIHSAALSAMNFDVAISRNYHSDFFNPNDLILMNQFSFPVVVAEANSDLYRLFCNWDSLLAQSNNAKIVVCNFRNEIPNEEIRRISWLHVAQKQLFSWHSKTNIKCLHEYLQNIPQEIMQKFLNYHNTKSKIKLIQILSGKSDTAIRHLVNCQFQNKKEDSKDGR